MAISVTSAFVGTNVSRLLTLIVLGAQSIEKGLIEIIPSKYDRVYLPRFVTAADGLQARVDTPAAPSDSSTYDEKTITPGDAMWYDEFNPKKFESVWADFWPRGAMVDQILDPAVMAAFVETVRERINEQIDKLIWQGDTAGVTAVSFFDGYLKILAADGATNVVTPAGVITAANVISILESVLAACPAEVRESTSPALVMDHQDKYLYQEAARALDFKGSNISDAIDARFGGFPIVSVGGQLKDNIVMGNFGGPKRNFHAATWMTNDPDNLKIARTLPKSELWFIKALFRFGVQVGFAEEVVLYQPT